MFGEETSQGEWTDSDCRGDVFQEFLAESAPERIRETEQFRSGKMDPENGFDSMKQFVNASVMGLPPDPKMIANGILHFQDKIRLVIAAWRE